MIPKTCKFFIALLTLTLTFYGYAQTTIHQKEKNFSNETLTHFNNKSSENYNSYVERSERKEDIFDRYTWLINYVDPNNCDGTKVAVLDSFAVMLVYVETPDSTVFYYTDGDKACMLREGEDDRIVCPFIIGLEDPVETWECGGISTYNENVLNAMFLYEGTNSSDNIAFYRVNTMNFGRNLAAVGPFTVFAPTTSAFLSVYRNAYFTPSRPSEVPDNFRELLDNHIVAGNYLSGDLFDGQVLTSLSGEPLLVTKNGNELFINGAKIISKDRETANGVLYVVDKVLLIENILGCNDGHALNYNKNATQDDGSCEYEIITGCTDPEANNYYDWATQDDGSCEYVIPTITVSEQLYNEYEWTRELFSAENCSNYNKITVYIKQHSLFPSFYVETADGNKLYNYFGSVICEDTNDARTCEESFNLKYNKNILVCPSARVLGCNDADASNYNANATDNDGSCDYNIARELATTTNDMYEEFPWMNTLMEEVECAGTVARVYDMGSYNFVYIKIKDVGRLYHQNGTLYCTDRISVDCKENYKLDDLAMMWACNDDSDGTTEEETTEQETPQEEEIVEVEEQATTETIFEQFNWLSVITENANCEGMAVMVYNSGTFEYVYVETNNTGTLYFEDGEQATITGNMFEQFNWLSSIVDQANCNNITTYNKGTFQYIYVETETGGTLYAADGTYYCADRAGLNCKVFYGLTEAEDVWNCNTSIEEEEEAIPTSSTNLFNEFAWLGSITDVANCNGTKATVYNKGAFQYIYIETERGGTLYFEDGTKYCKDRTGLDCKEFYGLTDEYSTWVCDGGKFINTNVNSDFVSSRNVVNSNGKVKSLNNFEVKLYPNPTNNYVNIEFLQQQNKALAVTLYDVSGKVIQNFITADNFKLDLTTQTEGMYLLELRNDDNIQQHKVLKY